uniref:DNA ligase ATP-dependent N-terminal domain-containing protein n=1 Tax=Ditylenchus dipsaci TaxID=166011 RepID=A0A915CRB1_9BILA
MPVGTHASRVMPVGTHASRVMPDGTHASRVMPVGNHASWDSLPSLAKTLEQIEDTSSRLSIIKILSDFFVSAIKLSPKDITPSIYLCINQLGPAYEGLELGIAETNLIKAVSYATGRTVEKIKEQLAARGDLGIVAQESRTKANYVDQASSVNCTLRFQQAERNRPDEWKRRNGEEGQIYSEPANPCKILSPDIWFGSSSKLRIGLAEQSLLVALANAFTTVDAQKKEGSCIRSHLCCAMLSFESPPLLQ